MVAAHTELEPRRHGVWSSERNGKGEALGGFNRSRKEKIGGGGSGVWMMGEGGPTAGGAHPRTVGRRDCGSSTTAAGHGVALK
jgi:hypothetical protein